MAILTSKQIQSFFEEGLLVCPKFFSEDEVAKVIACAERLHDEAAELVLEKKGKVMHRGTQFVIDEIKGQLTIHRIVWAASAEPALLELGRQQKMLEAVSQLLDSQEADHLINQLHYKLPADNVGFFWHQDVKNRRDFDPDWHDVNNKGSFVQVIISLDGMTVENGGIFYIPKSHKKGDLQLNHLQSEEELQKVVPLDTKLPIYTSPGDVLFMSPYLVHGSYPNKSTAPRRIFINGFSYPGANNKQYPGEGSTERISLV